jgi:hypothetical protein
MPQRRGMPGFLNGSRWRCVEGWPRWLALYDLESLAALQTPEYTAVAGPNSTPWTKRILGFAKGYRREALEQIAPGDARIDSSVDRLVVAKFSKPEDANALSGAAQLRIYTDGWAIAGYRGDPPAREASATLWNIYVPYENQSQRD